MAKTGKATDAVFRRELKSIEGRLGRAEEKIKDLRRLRTEIRLLIEKASD